MLMCFAFVRAGGALAAGKSGDRTAQRPQMNAGADVLRSSLF
jgi:hypothetical protein